MSGTCYLTGKSCKTIEFIHNGKVFNISEELSEDKPIKKIREMIDEKLNKKSELITKIDDMAKSLGVSRNELLKMIGSNEESNEQTEQAEVKKEQDKIQSSSPPPVVPKPHTALTSSKDDGFKEVDGGLKSTIKASVSVDSEASDHVAVGGKAYSEVKTKDNKLVIETNKKVKSVDNVLLTKSDMGTTAIAVVDNDSGKVNKIITAVNPQTKDLVRGAASGGNRVGVVGGNAKECPVCKGTGITTINNKVCVKCGGSGFIFV